MQQLIRSILLLLLILVPTTLSAQKRKKEAPVDTVKVAFLNGIHLNFDLLGAYQMLSSDHGQWEGGMRINIKDKYFPAFEMGIGEGDQHEEYNEASWCKTKAPYFRIGCDFNILRDKHDIYKIFAGVRYGFSKFDYDITVGEQIPVEDNPDTPEVESGNETIYHQHNGLNASYHWLEGVFGVNAKIWGPLHLGWDVRYRRHLSSKYAEQGEPWYIPGYGNNNVAGFTALVYASICF